MIASIELCRSEALRDSGSAVGFDVCYQGQTCRAFAVRYNGQVYAYLNRCTHVPMEMDWKAQDHKPEDSFYVWGPQVPDDFITNHESAARRAAA